MPTTRKALKAQTRRKVLDAAKSLFEQKGYDGTTMRDVASTAGVALGTIFVHFPDKGSLLIEALLDDLDDINAEVFADLPEGIEDQIVHLVTCAFDYWARRPELSKVFIRRMWSIEGEAGDRYRREVEEFIAHGAALLEHAKPDQIRDNVDTHIVAQAIYSFYTMTLLRNLGTEGFGKPEMIDQMRRFVHQLFVGLK